MGKKVKIGIGICVGLLLAVILVVGGYVVYMQAHFYRIPDHTALAVENNREAVLETGHTYTAVTYNVGFGAYGPDYSFFMDTGEMKDGTKTQGIYGKAVSREDTEKNTSGSVRILNDLNADFMLLQEVDEDADRSYHLNQVSCLKESFPDYSSVFVNNFHTAYLLYPFSDPHGAVQAGLLNFSRYKSADAIRRSYPVDDSFITKFTDLDRCFSVMRFPVKDGKELVLVNSHMSAYDEGGKIRVQQLELLNSVMAEEYEAGNYVIVGGDFNHAMGEAVAEGFATEQKFPAWVSVLTSEELADGIRMVRAENELDVPTCRGADIPYIKGVNYTTVVDGFLVSANIRATAENIDADFAYSDHNPVKLTFELMD